MAKKKYTVDRIKDTENRAVFQRIYSQDRIKDKKTGRLIKTSQERFKNIETGEIISRRQRDKVVKSIPKTIRVSLSAQNKALAKSFIEKQARKGKILSLRQANLSDKYTKLVKDLRRGAKLRRDNGRGSPEFIKGSELIRKALEQTTRRDLVAPDIIPGESA